MKSYGAVTFPHDAERLSSACETVGCRYSEHQTARRGAMAKLAALQNRL